MTSGRQPALQWSPLPLRGIEVEIAASVLTAESAVLIQGEAEVRAVDLLFDDDIAREQFAYFFGRKHLVVTRPARPKPCQVWRVWEAEELRHRAFPLRLFFPSSNP